MVCEANFPAQHRAISMAIIYIADSSGQQTHCSEHEAQSRWREGRIARDSLYWQHGMEGWRPVVEYFERGMETSAAPQAMPPAPPRGFVKNPAGLTQFVVVMLWISVVSSSIATLLSAFSLASGHASQPESTELTPFEAASALFALVQLTIFLTTAIGFLRWIHRAHLNVRGLGATDLNISPGWAVGWFFVPIMNLWKPYQAMKELCQASRNPDAWKSEMPPGLITTWWTLWVLSNILAQTSFRLNLRSDDPTSMIPELCTLLSDLADIPLSLVVIRMVRSIHEMQSEWAARPRNSSV